MRLLMVVVSALLASAPAAAQVYLGHGDAVDERSEIFQDGFGRSVVVFDEELLVSADDAGAVFVYGRESGGWVERQRIRAPGDHPWQSFGYSMVRAGDRVIVGAPNARLADGLHAGAAYSLIADPTTGEWAVETTLTGPLPVESARFGDTLAYIDGMLFVGTPNVMGGRVHVYTFDASTENWVLKTTLAGDEDVIGAAFGSSITAHGAYLAVGAPGEQGGAGGVYTYSLAGGINPHARITDQTGETRGGFGRSLSVAGERLFVGAFAGDFNPWETQAPGSAQLFEFTDEGLTHNVSFTENAAVFGYAVLLLDEHRALVGAPGERTVYSFDEAVDGSWVRTQRLFEPMQTAFLVKAFGEHLTLSDGRLFVGAPSAFRHIGMAMSSGSLYEIPMIPPPLADLALSVAGPAVVAGESAYDVTFTVSNDGPTNVAAAYIDVHPRSPTLPPGCQELFSAMRCELGGIEVGAEVEFVVTTLAPPYPPMDSTEVRAYVGSELAEPDTLDNYKTQHPVVAEVPVPLDDGGGGSFGGFGALFLLAMLKSRIRLRRSAPCSARTCGLPASTPNSR